MKQTVRIIGGRFRGKKLHFPAIQGLRPTPNSVRETLFNWLMHDIRDARCLDAFAGSGALGLEAYSRGASKVTFLEQNTDAYNNLLNVVSTFNSPALCVKKTDTIDFLQHTNEQYDIIFLDPPFTKNYVPPCLLTIAQSNLLVAGGLIYVESSQPITVDQTLWQPTKSKQAGQVMYGLYTRL